MIVSQEDLGPMTYMEMKETTYYFVITILALRHLESASHYAMYFVSTVTRFEIHISSFNPNAKSK